MATSPATRFVASQDPPIPTSNTPSATGLSANDRNASAVRASKYVTSPKPSSSTCRSTGSRCSHSSANASSAIGSPQTSKRSVTESRCGEVNRPVEIPCAHATAAATRAAVVLPFVPVAWIVGYVSSG